MKEGIKTILEQHISSQNSFIGDGGVNHFVLAIDDIDKLIKDKVDVLRMDISRLIQDYPEDINAVLPGIMEAINYQFDKEDEQRGPECQICLASHKLLKFISEDWLNAHIGEGKMIWICPNCIEKKYKQKVNICEK